MEVSGHHLHLIHSLPVGEPAPEGSGLAGFFKCLGTTEVVPNHLYSKQKRLPSFHRQRDIPYANHGT